jgi:hypothetical protein
VQPLQSGGPEPEPFEDTSDKPEQQPSRRQQVLLLEIQDRFGCLFLDYKGAPRLCFMFGGLRGVLLGIFIGGAQCLSMPACCSAKQDRHPPSFGMR